MVPDTHLLKLLFLTRYINCSLERSANFLACPLGKVPSEARRKGAVRYINYCLWLSAVLLASPRGEVASRSDDGEGTVHTTL